MCKICFVFVLFTPALYQNLHDQITNLIGQTLGITKQHFALIRANKASWMSSKKFLEKVNR